MKGIPQGRYTKEFREEAVKMVLDGRHFITGSSPSVIITALEVRQLGKGA